MSAGGGVIFNPMLIDDCEVWLEVDFDDITTSGSEITVWPNHGLLGGNFAPGGTGPDLVTRNGKPAARFTQGVDRRMVSSLAASNFNYLHDGTGSTTFVVLKPAPYPMAANASVLMTNHNSAATPGVWFTLGADERVQITVQPGPIANSFSGTDEVWPRTNRPHILIWSTEETGITPEYTIDRDGEELVASDFTGACSASDAQYPLTIGNWPLGGAGTAMGGDLQAVVSYSRKLSASEEAAVVAWLEAKYQYSGVVVFDGDSLTLGFGGEEYPMQLEMISELPFKLVNTGVTSRQVPAMVTAAPTVVDPHYDPSKPFNWVVVWCGTNDIVAGETAADIYTDLTTYIAARQAVGWQVMVCTIIDRGLTGDDAGFDTTRASLNTLINANTAGADAVVDLFDDARFDAGSSTDTAIYNADQIHLTGTNITGGYAGIAELIGIALDAQIQPTWNPLVEIPTKVFSAYIPALGVSLGADPALVDGDMEAANMAAWTQLRANAEKVTSPVYAGSRAMHLFEDGANDPLYYQNVMVAGQRIQVDGYARGDGGSGQVNAGDFGLGTRFWSGGTQAFWVAKSGEATAGSANFTLQSPSAIGSESWADNIVLTTLSVTAWADQHTGSHDLAQATAVNQPWIGLRNGEIAVICDGTTDHVVSDEAASVWPHLSDGTGMTVVSAYWLDTSSQINGIWDTGRLSNTAYTGAQIYHRSDVNNVSFTVGNGGGTGWVFQKASGSVYGDNAGYVTTGGYEEGAVEEVIFRVNQTDIYRGARDGEAPSSGAPNYPFTLAARAGTGFPLDGALGTTVVFKELLPMREIAATERWAALSLAVTV
jgi:hypothetical protein